MNRSKRRHIAKTITWRIVGTIDTILLAFLISGDANTAVKIGLFEVFTKMILYYCHERIWFNYKRNKNKFQNSHKRHLAKTITWRVIGTVDTMVIAWIISGDPMIGLQVGLAEIFTKMILYYIHERIWYKLNFGLGRRQSGKGIS